MAATYDAPRSHAVGASAGGAQAWTTMMGSRPGVLPVNFATLFDESSE